jgi:hypothetical protein
MPISMVSLHGNFGSSYCNIQLFGDCGLEMISNHTLIQHLFKKHSAHANDWFFNNPLKTKNTPNYI